MKLTFAILSVSLIVFCSNSTTCAQEAVLTTGGNATGSGGSISFSAGQAAYSSLSGVNGRVTEGVQQPYEIYVITGLDELAGIELNCRAYPNPTTRFLYLNIEQFNYRELSYRLFNVQGRLLKEDNITQAETIISMEEFVPATYFLHVYAKNEEVKTFKIIKH